MRKRLVEGVDNRSVGAVRFRRLVRGLAQELGGMAALPEADQVAIRQAASLAMRAEQLQAAIVRGDDVNPDELIRLTGASRRALETVRKRAKPKPAF